MRLNPVLIKGKIHRLSDRALELLNLEKVTPEDRPITMQKLPPNLEILKIQKAEPKVEVTKTITEQPVEVKKNEDVIVANAEEVKEVKEPKKRRRRVKVGTEK